MPQIVGFAIEKQAGSELCWAAATKSVFDSYYPGVSPDQVEIQRRFGKPGQEAGSPEQALRDTGALNSVESFDGDEAARGQAARIFLKIENHIRRGEPVIVYVQQTAGGEFRHALVVYKTEVVAPDEGEGGPQRILSLKDPGNPALDLQGEISQLMYWGWRIYGSIPQLQYLPLRVIARKFFFTEKPRVLGFQAALR